MSLAALLVASLAASAAWAGDGQQRWKTLESPHFVVHYYEPLGDVGRRVAAVAERSHTILAPVFDHEPSEKTHIVLNDMTDGANGFANVLPRNRITLFVTAPSGLSVLNDHDDWLYGLTAHEYTHILHLDSIGGLAFFYNKVFGKTWAPNQLQPRWIIEGLATHEESKRSSSGRTRSALFDMEMRVAVLAGVPLELDRMSAGPRGWPHGNTAYLYGSHFLKYVFDRYGEDRIKDLSWAYGANPIPYGVNHSVAAATGRHFDELYDEWTDYMRNKYRAQLEGIERRGRAEGRRLTFTGESNGNPRYSPDGSTIVFRQSDGLSRGRFRSIPAGSNAARVGDYAIADRAGGFDVLADGSLVVEQTANVRTNYSWQDLFLWRSNDAPMTRLTYGARARDPAVSPDERHVAFTMNGPSQSSLAVIPLQPDATPEVLWTGAHRYSQAYSPEWSPDGRKIVFSAWRAGGYRDVLLFDLDTRAVEELTHDRALDTDPVFSPDGKYVYFSSDRTGIYNIFAYELSTHRLLQVTNVLGCALVPEPSPDGKTLLYQGFDVGGYDIFELRLEPATWIEADPYINDRPEPTSIHEVPGIRGPRDYRPLETLAPQSYSLTLTTNSLGNAITLETDGSDVVGWHGYRLAATLSTDEGDVAMAGSYSYNRLWPGFRIAGSRNAARRSGVFIDGRTTLFTEEVMGATAGVSLPVMRGPTANASLSVDYDFDWLRNTEDDYRTPDPNDLLPRFPETDVLVGGLALRLNFSDTRGFIYTIGPQEGKLLALSMRLNHPSLGSDFESIDLNYRWEWFVKLPFSPTSVVSTRLAGGLRATNRRRTGVFSLGGVPEQAIVDSVLNNIRAASTGYLRGFPERSVFGSQYHLLNLELRQQLVNVERGLATLPVYVRRLHLAALLDAGNAFDGPIDLQDFRASVGGAMRADLVLGYFVPGSLDIGYSRGLTSGGVGEFWMLLTGTI